MRLWRNSVHLLIPYLLYLEFVNRIVSFVPLFCYSIYVRRKQLFEDLSTKGQGNPHLFACPSCYRRGQTDLSLKKPRLLLIPSSSSVCHDGDSLLTGFAPCSAALLPTSVLSLPDDDHRSLPGVRTSHCASVAAVNFFPFKLFGLLFCQSVCTLRWKGRPVRAGLRINYLSPATSPSNMEL